MAPDRLGPRHEVRMRNRNTECGHEPGQHLVLLCHLNFFARRDPLKNLGPFLWNLLNGRGLHKSDVIATEGREQQKNIPRMALDRRRDYFRAARLRRICFKVKTTFGRGLCDSHAGFKTNEVRTVERIQPFTSAIA